MSPLGTGEACLFEPTAGITGVQTLARATASRQAILVAPAGDGTLGLAQPPPEVPMRPAVRLAVVGLVASLAPTPAAAQADPDTREVVAYQLTMPKLRQLNQAFAELLREQESDPAYQALAKKKRELAALSEKDELTDAEAERLAQLEDEISRAEEAGDEGGEADQSLSAMAARMAADPRVAGALRRAGLAPREAAVMQLALIQAAFAAELLKSGTIKEVPKDVSAANVKFYQANEAEIAALTALGGGEDRR